jgi:triosephosphate isomerase
MRREETVRKPFIAGNWKMNLNRSEAVELAAGLTSSFSDAEVVDVAICPPFVYLDAVLRAVDNGVSVGAQDVYFEASGAYTGEISCEMLVDLGCRYCILGHSERRQLMGESNETVNRKLKAVLVAGLQPIVCVGETLEQREGGKTKAVIADQVAGSLAGIGESDAERLVIAYEPVWAIGTGKVATPEVAEETHADIRSLLEKQYNQSIADTVRIQYGGSVKPDNAATLLAQPNIDGALVGGAALKADSFLAIIEAAVAQARPA